MRIGRNSNQFKIDLKIQLQCTRPWPDRSPALQSMHEILKVSGVTLNVGLGNEFFVGPLPCVIKYFSKGYVYILF